MSLLLNSYRKLSLSTCRVVFGSCWIFIRTQNLTFLQKSLPDNVSSVESGTYLPHKSWFNFSRHPLLLSQLFITHLLTPADNVSHLSASFTGPPNLHRHTTAQHYQTMPATMLYISLEDTCRQACTTGCRQMLQ